VVQDVGKVTPAPGGVDAGDGEIMRRMASQGAKSERPRLRWLF
jgi:hypothetical protein